MYINSTGKRQLDFGTAMRLRSVSIKEFQQETVLRVHPGDAASIKGHSGEWRPHDFSADSSAEFQVFIQGFHFVTQVMQPATPLQKICDGRPLGDGFYQLYERKFLDDSGKERHLGILQRILKDFLIPRRRNGLRESIRHFCD
jgi:hypothetical protein